MNFTNTKKHFVWSIFLGLILMGCGQDTDRAAGMGQERAAQSLGTHTYPLVCADDDIVHGIDVSHWQGEIDWDAVAASGIRFAFIRVSDGTGTLDRYFQRNWAEAARVGILRGIYQYFRPNQNIDGQVNIILDHLQRFGAGELPPVIDVEERSIEDVGLWQRTVAQWSEAIQAATGLNPIVYTSPSFWDSFVQDPSLEYLTLWIAHWGATGASQGPCGSFTDCNEPAACFGLGEDDPRECRTPRCPDLPGNWANWVFHQFSSRGSVSGISGNLDLNVFNGNLEELQAFAEVVLECGDGICNGMETSEDCPEDCPVCEAIPAEGRIVDEQEVCFEAGGDPRWWREEEAGHDDHLYWTHTTASFEVANYAQWNLNFSEGGRYQVEAYLLPEFAQSEQATYQVVHNGETTPVDIDQSSADGWLSVGEFEFAAGADQFIRFDDNTGEPNSEQVRMMADALRFTRLDLPPAMEDMGVVPDMGPEMDAMVDAMVDAMMDTDGGMMDGGPLPDSGSMADGGPAPVGASSVDEGCRCDAASGGGPTALILFTLLLGLRRRR